MLEIKEALNGESQARAEGWHPGEIKCGSRDWPWIKLGSHKSLLADENGDCPANQMCENWPSTNFPKPWHVFMVDLLV